MLVGTYIPKLLLLLLAAAPKKLVAVAGGAPANEKPFAVFFPPFYAVLPACAGRGRAGRWGGPRGILACMRCEDFSVGAWLA